MEKIYYLILFFYLVGCAVQGPISGGPVDEDAPQLVSAIPENFSTEISKNQKITLIFDELIDPISIYESLNISNQDFSVKVRGKKIIISPIKEWNTDFLIEIYINRLLSDYQDNALTAPINLFYSFGESIPSNKIHGQIFDIQDVINRYNSKNKNILFDVGLFKISDSDTSLVKTVQSNSNLEFEFSAVDNGVYCIVAIEDKLIDIAKDLYARRYSISSGDILINSDQSDSVSVRLNIANPISRENISSINFINQYYINYILTDGEIRPAVIDTIYNNFKDQDFSGEALKVSLSMENDFENYQTDIFEFIVLDLIDTIPPQLLSINIDNVNLELKFSEPIEKINDQELFYIVDSNNVYLDFPYTFLDESPSLKNSIIFKREDIIKEDLPSLFSLNVKENIIKDLYGNIFPDSVVTIDLNNQIKDEQGVGSGGIFGKVLHSYNESINLVVSLYNAETFDRYLVLTDQDFFFSFEKIPAGQYYLQAYENYNSNTDFPYPYFGGIWNSSNVFLKFSNIFGPVEVRSNWDIQDMVINLE